MEGSALILYHGLILQRFVKISDLWTSVTDAPSPILKFKRDINKILNTKNIFNDNLSKHCHIHLRIEKLELHFYRILDYIHGVLNLPATFPKLTKTSILFPWRHRFITFLRRRRLFRLFSVVNNKYVDLLNIAI